jgi:hypothetical protein
MDQARCLDNSQIDYVFNCVLNHLQDTSINTEFKPNLFLILGTLVCQHPNNFRRDIPLILRLFEFAYEAALANTTGDTDNEINDYYEYFREALLESILMVTSTVDDNAMLNVSEKCYWFNHAEKIANFVFRSCHKTQNAT